jgi:hypothetical protein
VTSGIPARVANYYHGIFSRALGYNTMDEIASAVRGGATVVVGRGLMARNVEVGKADAILAYTFGPRAETAALYLPEDPGHRDAGSAGLKDGRTAHTWSHSKARAKVHLSLPTIDGRALVAALDMERLCATRREPAPESELDLRPAIR